MRVRDTLGYAVCLASMGNPAILNFDGEVELATPVQAPPSRHALWAVYCLRKHGVKLSRSEVLQTVQVGKLRLWRETKPDKALNAWLIDPSGYPALGNLIDVTVVRLEPAGMLLHGGVMGTAPRGVPTMYPQAWWCVVHQLVDEAP